VGDRTCTLEQHASMSAGDMVFHTSLHSKRAIRTAGACTVRPPERESPQPVGASTSSVCTSSRWWMDSAEGKSENIWCRYLSELPRMLCTCKTKEWSLSVGPTAGEVHPRSGTSSWECAPPLNHDPEADHVLTFPLFHQLRALPPTSFARHSSQPGHPSGRLSPRPNPPHMLLPIAVGPPQPCLRCVWSPRTCMPWMRRRSRCSGAPLRFLPFQLCATAASIGRLDERMSIRRITMLSPATMLRRAQSRRVIRLVSWKSR
jgi:hypothetical protein